MGGRLLVSEKGEDQAGAKFRVAKGAETGARDAEVTADRVEGRNAHAPQNYEVFRTPAASRTLRIFTKSHVQRPRRITESTVKILTQRVCESYADLKLWNGNRKKNWIFRNLGGWKPPLPISAGGTPTRPGDFYFFPTPQSQPCARSCSIWQAVKPTRSSKARSSSGVGQNISS